MPMTEDRFTEPDNNDRADFANDAVSAYFERTRLSDPYPADIGALDDDDREALTEVLGDLLCDLRHWADVTGIDFDDASETGEGNYVEEFREELLSNSAPLVTATEGHGKGLRLRREAAESLMGGAE